MKAIPLLFVLFATLAHGHDCVEFLHAIGSQPRERTTRLVFADWLDEHGAPTSAQWLRLVEERRDLEGSRTFHGFAQQRILADRMMSLVGSASAEWRQTAYWKRLSQYGTLYLNEGLPTLSAVKGAKKEMLLNAPSEDIEAILALDLSALRWTATDLDRFLSRGPKHLLKLFLRNNPIGDAGAESIATCYALGNLTELDLEQAGITDEGVAHLAGRWTLRNLVWLDLSNNALGSNAVRALAQGSFEHLSELRLRQNGLNEGATLEFASARMPALRKLHLARNEIETCYLAVSPLQLTHLYLAHNPLSMTTVSHLTVEGSKVHTLLHLDLKDCGVNDAVCHSFGDPRSALRDLQRLELEGNPITPAGISSIIRNGSPLTSLFDLGYPAWEIGKSRSDCEAKVQRFTTQNRNR